VTRALALVALSVACASTPPSSLVPDDLLVAMQVADELERDRLFALAREQLIAVAEHADTPERADSLRLRGCELWARQGDAERAGACYRNSSFVSDEMRALAQHRLAALELELDDLDSARAGMRAVVEEYPATDAARRSLRGARALAREAGGPPAEVELLERVADALRERAGSEPAVRELYLEAVVGAAERRLAALEDAQGAEELLRPVVESDAGKWLDDALIWRARALARLGAHDDALTHYQRIIDDRESSWFVGSYDSVFLDDALFERAELLEQLGRRHEARAAFEELIDEVPESRLVDDAAFRAARLVGEPSALERFVVDYPESRHVREARELLGAP